MQARREEGRIFLSNGLTSVLELNGEIEWFPCPRFDSDPLFLSILGDNSSFSIRPLKQDYYLSTKYMPHSLVVENRFSTKKGDLVVLDFLPIGKPELVRKFDSELRFRIELRPSVDYGREKPLLKKRNNRSFVAKLGRSEKWLYVELISTSKYKISEPGVFEMEPGKGYIACTIVEHLQKTQLKPRTIMVDRQLKTTNQYWHGKISNAKRVSRFKDAYETSLLAVLGMIYGPSGAIIAAPTTSLPEIVGGTRNWDYRYVWIRDSSYAAEALVAAGLLKEAHNIIEFLARRALSKGGLHPFYAIDGGRPGKERIVEWLSGYKNSRPVRVGNAAYKQVQMDSEGNFINALFRYVQVSGDIGFLKKHWRQVEKLAGNTERSWTKKSTSLWEEREERRHFVHTKMMQWVALDRASKLAARLAYSKKSERWRLHADMIKEDVLRRGFSQKCNSFVKYYGSEEVDAALLTMPLYGFISAKDKRFLSTLKRIEDELSIASGLLVRYKSNAIGKAVNPFALLSAWLARVYIRTGDKVRARQAIERLVRYSNSHMLLGENIDYKKHEQTGNFPQLFSHAGLIDAIIEYNKAYIKLL